MCRMKIVTANFVRSWKIARVFTRNLERDLPHKIRTLHSWLEQKSFYLTMRLSRRRWFPAEFCRIVKIEKYDKPVHFRRYPFRWQLWEQFEFAYDQNARPLLIKSNENLWFLKTLFIFRQLNESPICALCFAIDAVRPTFMNAKNIILFRRLRHWLTFCSAIACIEFWSRSVD